MIGAVILLFDVFCKISYYNTSRFASTEIKGLYYRLLFFRPIMLVLGIFYNFLARAKNLWKIKNKKDKKYKDDIAYQKDLSLMKQKFPDKTDEEIQTELDAKGSEHKAREFNENLIDAVKTNLFLVILGYTGFIRLIPKWEGVKLAVVLSQVFEMFTHNVPLMIIQGQNNKFLKKYDTPLVWINILFSVLNGVDLFCELLLNQIIYNNSEAQKTVEKHAANVTEDLP